jgi:hypothetical protein
MSQLRFNGVDTIQANGIDTIRFADQGTGESWHDLTDTRESTCMARLGTLHTFFVFCASVLSLSKAFLLSGSGGFQIRAVGLSLHQQLYRPLFRNLPPSTGRTSKKTQSITWRASASLETDLCGIYSWSYSGGNFPVELRSGGNFYCKSYQAASKWELEGNKVKIDWKKYGKYELEVVMTAAS